MSALRRLNLQPMTDPLAVRQSVSEPAMMPLQLGLRQKHDRVRTITSQFVSKEGTTEWLLIDLDDRRYATAGGSSKEVSSLREDDDSI